MTQSRRVKQWQEENECYIRNKSEWWLHRLIGSVVPSWNRVWYTTLRKPGDKWPTIWAPDSVDIRAMVTIYESSGRHTILHHELFHVEQQRTWFGVAWTLLCMVFPLPVLFSGRWFVEREAYLEDIIGKRYTVDQAVNILWHDYGWAWPRAWMRQWFEAEIRSSNRGPS